jgi:hypothetical protein
MNASVMQALELGDFGKLDARVSVVNLFDRSYLTRDGSGIGVGAPQFGARRELYVPHQAILTNLHPPRSTRR